MLISRMRYTEHGPNHYRSIKAVLPSLLGTLGRLEEQVQAIPCPWPTHYLVPHRVAIMAFRGLYG